MKIQRAFPYFGSKTRLAELYPAPERNLIIEPFAGAAAYSQRHWQKRVLLSDLDPDVVACWKFLIAARSKDILDLPDAFPGQDISAITNLSDGERALLQFYAYDGFAGVKGRLVGKRCIWNRYRPVLASMVHRFNHWNVRERSYATVPNSDATWFVDPPYQFGGENYQCSNRQIDFRSLGSWCKSRTGQLIVCENMRATWLPFKPLAQLAGIRWTTTEAIYTNDGPIMASC